MTNRPLRNRQEITNVQCFAKNKYICQELEEFSSLVVVFCFIFMNECCFHMIRYMYITSNLSRCNTLSSGNYLSRLRSKFQRVLNCYFVIIILTF